MTMGQRRWWRIVSALSGRFDDGDAMSGLCSACAETLSVAGAGLTIMADSGVQVPMCGSDATAGRLGELEFTLGNGPAFDAHERGVTVVEADLVRRPPTRWAGYVGAAVDAGICAIFAFPLRLGAARLGALTLYQAHPGRLADDVYTDAHVAAEVVTRAVLARQGGLGGETLTADLSAGAALQAEVHQAAGMVSVQLGVGVVDALARLRARAFAADRPLGEVAGDVVARRLRFDE